jgi:Amt family ammonium transporter
MKLSRLKTLAGLGALGAFSAAPMMAFAQAAAPTMDKGDNAWMLVSTLLVLLMILPGLALFYGGLVRSKNMLSMLMQVGAVTVIGMIAWVLWGYSLAFTDGGGLDKFVGGGGRLFLNGVTPASLVATFSTGVAIPELTFIAFQMTFACITAALVLGGVAERMKFGAVCVFAVLWPLLSYYPMAHMVWWWAGPDAVAAAPTAPIQAGLIWSFGALDFAGGTVVHINAGIAALVGAVILGKRTGYKTEAMPPHSLTLTMVGAGLLWVGWFGFNAGSNLEANGYASLAFINTLVATAAAGLSWVVVEMITHKKASALGLASGIVAGLVAITPAAGFVLPVPALIIGLVAGLAGFWGATALKHWCGYDDSLDAFGVHGVCGIVGALLTGVFAYGPLSATPAAPEGIVGSFSQFTLQVYAVAATFVFTAIGTFILLKIIDVIIGLRVTEEEEREGLDVSLHGERLG